MISLFVDVGGAIQKLDTIAENASDLDPVLRKFGGYLRKRAIERYKAQNFAPLADSTLKERVEKGVHSLERKLSSDVRKATRRAGGQKPPRGFLSMILASPQISNMSATQSRGVQKRIAVLAEFQKQHRKRGTDLKTQAQGTALSLKQMSSLKKRTERAVAKAIAKKILGSLPRTLEVELTGKGQVTLVSSTGRSWTEVHNAGGTAGHGAKIPKRETIKIEQQDLEVLTQMLHDHLTPEGREKMGAEKEQKALARLEEKYASTT